MKILLTICIFLSFSFIVHASPEQVLSDYEKLKNIPCNYKDFGTICEQVAILRLKETYPSHQYNFYSGIIYNYKHNTIGELDVVVTRKSDGEAILIGEVKCWRNLKKAYKKAINQLNRFKKRINNQKVDEIFLKTSPEEIFTEYQFDENPQYITISQEGKYCSKFTMTLGLNLEEIKKLRKMIYQCQKSGECPRP